MIQPWWIEDIKTFRQRAAEWDEALLASRTFNPFLLSDFIITWWGHYGQGRALRIAAFLQDGRIVGGLPLCLTREGARSAFARVLSHVGGSAANYTEPFCAATDALCLPVLGDALAARADWDVLYLSDVRPESRLLQEYRQGALNHHLGAAVLQEHSNWAIDLSAGVERYLATVSKKLRRDLRAKRRHAEQRYGPLRLQPMHGAAEVAQYADLYTTFSERSFDARQRMSAFRDPRQAAFFREFLVRMEEQHRLDAHVLLAGETVLAISFGYRFGPGFQWVLTTFNYACEYVRPGYLLIEELIKELGRRGETRYNWYGHDRFYKGQWCNQQTPLFRFLVTRATVRAWGYRTLRAVGRSVRSRPAVAGWLQARPR